MDAYQFIISLMAYQINLNCLEKVILLIYLHLTLKNSLNVFFAHILFLISSIVVIKSIYFKKFTIAIYLLILIAVVTKFILLIIIRKIMVI